MTSVKKDFSVFLEGNYKLLTLKHGILNDKNYYYILFLKIFW